MCGGARSKIRHVMFDFDMVSEIITFEEKADEITLANDEDVFTAMLWYNKCESDEKENATKKLFNMLFKVMKTSNISDDNINHIIRTLRGFLEGFVLLVNNNAFGNPVSIKESFDLSLEIIINGIKSLEGVE